jgi:hypothetical protein
MASNGQLDAVEIMLDRPHAHELQRAAELQSSIYRWFRHL